MVSHSPSAPSRRLGSDRQSKSQGRRHANVTPLEYANLINAHAKLSSVDTLYPGNNFGNLATYLLQPYQSHAPMLSTSTSSTTASNPPSKEFYLSLYNLNDRTTSGIRHFLSPSQFSDSVIEPTRDENNGHLLFMRGNLSPDWLNAIGAKFRVDPEFFQRHLDFRSTVGRPEYFPLPPLPSAAVNMTRLRLVTVGNRTVEARSRTWPDQHQLETWRQEGAKSLRSFVEKLTMGRESDTKSGDSIVREFSVHDHQHFSFEQDMSLHIMNALGGWLAIVWLDMGNNLSEGPQGPWTSDFFKTDPWAVNYHPVLQQKACIALENQTVASQRGLSHKTLDRDMPNKIEQSVSLLHLDYGRKLDAEILPQDPLYALYDIFHLSASSEVQFLNMMQTKLKRELSPLSQQRSSTLSNLLYHKQIVERHIQRIKENKNFIEVQIASEMSNRQTPERAEAVTTALLKDFDYLLSQAQDVSTECDRHMSVVMNETMIMESEKAILQAEGVAKLTRLAFFFIPLSFTTSFFGMNFFQISSESPLDIWVWFASSAPILALSIVFMLRDIPQDLRRMYCGFLIGVRSTRRKARKPANLKVGV
ncbi:MAG: hypothetical protein M1816_002940 [Peltula sp. TS41687]|nr:MAG: hypothetical protein M1816_002940 [Peltula sp. TS41687]